MPQERIKEDYLRILRYFRFFTQYSKLDHDQDTIKSIRRNINGLNKISNERIFDELKKILSLKNIYYLLANDQSKEIILNIFPQFIYYEKLKKIDELNQKFREKFDSDLIMAILVVDKSSNYEYFCHKYRTSNSTKNRFENISKNFENLKNKKFYLKENIKRLIYFTDKKKTRDLLLFSIFANDKIDSSAVEKLLIYVNTCTVPKFPISGDYLKKYGYKSSPSLGKKLKTLEEKWIKNNFILDKHEVKKFLSRANQS